MSTELFSFSFFATGPENRNYYEEDEEDDDDDDDGDDDEGGDDEGGDDEEEHLELEVEGQDKAAAYSSHCAPTFILLNILCPDLYCSTFCAYIYIAKHFVPRFILFKILSLHFVPRFLPVNILHQVFFNSKYLI